MAERTLRLFAVYDGSSADAGMARTAVVADETANKLGVAGRKAGDDFASGIDHGTSKLGGVFQRAGASASNLGIPLAGSLTNMGQKLDEASAKGKGFGATMSAIGGITTAVGVAGLAVAGAESVKLAGNFQQLTERLVTGAGESQGALKGVQKGILSLAPAMGDTPTALADSMYMVESAGYHGAAGLQVLKAAAEGAKAEGASVEDVGNALTSALNAYKMPASSAIQMTNEMLAAVGAGKMRMEDFAKSLSNVLPEAAAAGISFAQVGGAVATMTSQGMSAQQATQDLANTIRSIQAPNSVAVTEMEQLGLRANDVSQNLGQRGLTGTIGLLTQTIAKNMGPSGLVILNAFNQSQSAAADLQKMLAAMPPNVAKLAQTFMSGALSMSQFRKEVPTTDQGMLGQFAALYAKVNGFNSALKSGTPAAQTFEAALAKMMGGATGLNTALLLSGSHAATFNQNVKTVGDAANHTGQNIENWKQVQGLLNFQLQQAQAGAESLAVKFGDFLIPKITGVEHAVADLIGWFEKHKVAAEVLGAVIVGVLGTAITFFAVTKAQQFLSGVGSMVQSMGRMGASALTTAAQWLTGAGEAEAANEGWQISTAELAVKVQADSEAIQQAVLAATMADVQAAAGITTSNAEIDASFASTAGAAEAAGAGVKGATVGMVGAAETADVGITAALGSTGVGLAIIGLSAAATELALHWSSVWSAIENAAVVSANGIIHGLNGVIHAINFVTGLHVGTVETMDHPSASGGGGGGGTTRPEVGPPMNPALYPGGKIPDWVIAANEAANTNNAMNGLNVPQIQITATQGAGANLPTIPDVSVAPVPSLAGGGGGRGPIPNAPAIPVAGRGTSPSSTQVNKMTPGDVALALQGLHMDSGITTASKGPTDQIGQQATIKALTSALTPTTEAALHDLVNKLNATHQTTLAAMANHLENDWNTAAGKLQSIIDADTQAGQSELTSLQTEQTDSVLNSLKNALTGQAKSTFDQLVSNLTAVHTAAAADLVTQLKAQFAADQAQLSAELVLQQQTADADTTKLTATQLTDQTSMVANAQKAQVQAIQDSATSMSDSIAAAAQAITDSAKMAADASAAVARGIDDQTQAMNDQATAQVQAIAAAAQIRVDTLAERGLYGLNLVAQRQTVQLDQMKAGFETQIAAAQQAVDAAKAQGNQSAAASGQALDAASSAQNAIVARLKATSDAVTSQQNRAIQGAQATLDQVTSQQDSLVQQAQAHVDAVAQGTQLQQQQAQSALTTAQANQQLTVAQAQAALSAAQSSAASAEAQASGALSAAQAQAQQVSAQAAATLSGAQANAAVIQAQAQQALAQAQDQAQVAEAQQQALIDVTKEQAQSQFAGSGFVVNFYGINPADAVANAAEASWVYRTQVANAG